jgi:AraC family transcriptional regulator, transcriptional activator of the genes for pyochelin and ferripyochelin receptors
VVNERKLKQGFRQIFGTTVFGYLHDHRMEQAKQMLAEQKLSVAEVAHAVGYSHLSHFASVLGATVYTKVEVNY